MLGIIERFWKWKAERKCDKFKSAHGYIVHRFKDKFAVVQRFDKSTNIFQYTDLIGNGYVWAPQERNFGKSALRTRSQIETKYGTLSPITKEEEDAHYAGIGK